MHGMDSIGHHVFTDPKKLNNEKTYEVLCSFGVIDLRVDLVINE